MINQERLKELLTYNPEDGGFSWIKTSRKAGCIANYGKTLKYVKIRIDGVLYFAHRLAWLYQTGEFPGHDIDHKNRNGLDNSWSNLRKCDGSQNGANRMPWRMPNGFKGIARNGRKWVAQISLPYSPVTKYLGIYATKEEAARAYDKAAIEIFGEFSVTNKSLGLLP